MATATPVVGFFGQQCLSGHSLLIYDRGGATRFNQIVDLQSIKYQRKLNTKTQAVIVVSGRACLAQSAVLNSIVPKRHEARLYRGDQIVWEGPIVDCMSTSSTFQITANDILIYLEGTSLSKDWPGPGTSVTRTNLLDNPSGLRGAQGYTAASSTLASNSTNGLVVTLTAAETAALQAGVALQTLTIGTAPGNLAPNTEYVFSCLAGSAVGQAPFELYATGAGLSTAVASNAVTVDGLMHAINISFTTLASGTVTIGAANSGACSIGNYFWLQLMQLEAGTGPSTYFDGSITSTGDQTFSWTGTTDNSISTAVTLVGPAGMVDRISAIIEYELTTAYEASTAAGTSVIPRWEQADPPANILPYLTTSEGPTQTTVATTAFEMSAAQHLYNLASSTGISFVTIGRMLRIWDGFLSQTRTLTEKDLSGDFQVDASGTDFSSVQHVTSTVIEADGDPQVGHAVADSDTLDYFGPWEIIGTTNETNADGSALTQSELNSQATAGLNGLDAMPIELIAQNGAVLILGDGLGINDLVPGTNIPVRSTNNIRNIDQMQMLLEVDVTETATGEQITVVIGTATSLAMA